jgi:transposase
MQRGESPTVIARILGVCRTSLYRWFGMAKESPEALAAKPHPGPAPRLTDPQIKELGLMRGRRWVSCCRWVLSRPRGPAGSPASPA